jgi:hypothetical protein
VSLKWQINRLRAMSVAEISSRMAQMLRARLEQCGVGLARAAAPSRAAGAAWLPALSTSFDVATYTMRADQILDGRFRVFALGAAPLGFPPDWNRDPKTGTCAPMSFGKLIDYRDARLVGDIKYLWEPNRHAELVTLAQAWHLSRDPRYAQACGILIDSWLLACPYPRGVNWTSSLELALRLVNWSFAWHILGGEAAILFEGDAGQSLRLRWLASVRQHCHFIAGHLSQYSSANNHLLGELLGLFVAATTWPYWRESRRWGEFARDAFEREALAQNGIDGVNLEQATWYHHETADMMLIALLYARQSGCEYGAEFLARWTAMLNFIAAIMDTAGNVPHIGDADDAVIARLDPRPDPDVFRSLLAAGAVLARDAGLRAHFKAKARVFDDKNRWLLGDQAALDFAAIGAPAPETALQRRAFPQGGYYILGSDFDRANEVRIVADAGPLGYLSIAAHGHADALAFTLSVSGLPILIDCGTYAYHTQENWRSYFRGTRAHNTLMVDATDQSVAGGKFLWTHHAAIQSASFESTADFDRLTAAHDGYRRLADPVIHRRELIYSKATRTLRVTDRLDAAARHQVELNWHFAPECTLNLCERHLHVTRGAAAVELRWADGFTARLARAEETPARGWVSPSFDVKHPCTSLVLQRETTGNWHTASEIRVLSTRE